MNENWAYVIGAALALGGPLLGYLLSVRKTSGRIRASDADVLWDEATAIRRECAERVKALEASLTKSNERERELLAEIYRLQRAQFGDGHA